MLEFLKFIFASGNRGVNSINGLKQVRTETITTKMQRQQFMWKFVVFKRLLTASTKSDNGYYFLEIK
ncbi:hypothetical protein BN997_00522 [Oceanobacillus oncorhynchi]|uniref:Uncharacterized protein n=1 Tax=Oceanobacillus oncorhynchi TaxID=545501 RepID=A0A0A1MCC7_9BACI|nr:hypothetical protein [Oceanobacillus oncorhynchi]CEI80713.1 hypothetical protein BN997_00522 [Oceanobacillus oncorhynchi]